MRSRTSSGSCLTSRDAQHFELYDLVADPYEKSDVKVDHPEVVADLLKQLSEWKASLPLGPDETCFSSERAK